MTKHSFSIKSLLFTIIVAMSLLIGSNVWAFATVFSNVRAADNTSTRDVITSAVSSNTPVATYNFESDTGSMPSSPSSFETITEENSSLKPEANGVISIDPESFKQNASKYKLDTAPAQRSIDNKKVLLINGNETSLYYGYKLKTDATLSRSSFYEIKVAVYTDQKATASVYLAGEDFDNLKESKIDNKNTYNSWEEFVFYVATSDTHASDLNIQLYLGAKAHTDTYSAITSEHYVLFDDITITRLSGTAFATSTASPNELMNIVDLRDAVEINSGEAGYVENGSFANGLRGWTEETSSTSGNILAVGNLNQQITVNDGQIILNTHQSDEPSKSQSGVVLSVNNGANVSIKSSDITIKQHQIYRIAFWAKGSLNSSTLAIKLAGTIDNGTEEGQEFSQTITSFEASTESINGSWGLYEFYVIGNPLIDTTINLSLGLTSTSNTDSGYLAVSDIRSYLITSEQMTEGTSANSNAKTLTMYSTSNTLSFKNYTFNLVELDDVNATVPNYPLTPQNWTASNELNTNSGVVNINESIWSQGPFKGIYRPTKANLSGYSDNDNVLMINGTSGQYQEYTSDTETLSASGYAKITFQANINSTSNAYVIVKNSDDVVLARITLSHTNEKWKEYSIYLHNYFNEQTISISLALGEEGSTVNGAAYFDNVKFDSSLTEDQFNDAVANSTTFVYDLNSNALSVTKDTNDSTPLMWELNTVLNENNAVINSGIYDYYTTNTTFINKNPGNPEGNDSNKIMVIHSGQPVYSAFESTLTYSFSASTYYKLSVWVKTSDLTQDTVTADDYTDDGRLIVHGASIILSNIDSSFTSINTSKSEYADENGWVKYTFYIYANEATTSNIQLGLGCPEMPTAGYAYFANLSITSLDEEAYENEILSYDTENLPSNVLLATNTPTDDDETTGGNFGNFDPFAFSTIIIAIAVIVAVVGVVIKKVRANAPKKSSKISNSYDRLQTLLKDVDRRERKTAVNHKIKLLREELAQSQAFLAEEIRELNKQKESYNTAKEIAKDNPNIELCAPDVKQMEKEIDIQTRKIEQIENDIAILEEEKARIEQQTKRAVKNLNVNKNTKIK